MKNRASLVPDGLGFPESLRLLEQRIWTCNSGSGEVLALSLDNTRETMAPLDLETLPLSIDWFPDRRFLIVDGPKRRLLCREARGRMQPAAVLSNAGSGPHKRIVATGDGSVLAVVQGLT